MAILDRYYKQCVLLSNDNGYGYKVIPELKKWVESEFPTLVNQDELFNLENKNIQECLFSICSQPNLDEKTRIWIFRSVLASQFSLSCLEVVFLIYCYIYLFRPALAQLSLRCYISEPIKGACEELRLKCKPQCDPIELLSYVLDDQGDILFVPYLKENNDKFHKSFSLEILSIYKEEKDSKSLHSWTWKLTLQNKEINKLCGVIPLSEWNALNQIKETHYSLLGLNTEQIELVKAYHKICSKDRKNKKDAELKENKNLRYQTWKEPTYEQKERMIKILHVKRIDVSTDLLINQLQSIAKKYFAYIKESKTEISIEVFTNENGENPITLGEDPFEILVQEETKGQLKIFCSECDNLVFCVIALYFYLQAQRLVEEEEKDFAALLPKAFELVYFDKKSVDTTAKSLGINRKKAREFLNREKLISSIRNFLVNEGLKTLKTENVCDDPDALMNLTKQLECYIDNLIKETENHLITLEQRIEEYTNLKKEEKKETFLDVMYFTEAVKELNTSTKKCNNKGAFFNIISSYSVQVKITSIWLKYLFGEYLDAGQLTKLTFLISFKFGNYLPKWKNLKFWLFAILKFNPTILALLMLELSEKIANLEETKLIVSDC